MTKLTDLTIAQAEDKLLKKEITATELTDAYLKEIESANDKINAYVAVTGELARTMAKASDERLRKGEAGPLEGIPIGVKDLFATKNTHTQACSKILENFKPPYESTITEFLWRDGAVMLGKLNMDEFAMGSSTETSCYGAAVNPWREKGATTPLVAGGSSGGSAAATAANLCAGATATDTGGSIRQPAAFTGTVGIKPTYGRCSRWGIVSFASSLDQAGPITKDVYDCALLLNSMAGYDAKDQTCLDLPVPDYTKACGQSIKGLNVGVPKEYRVDGIPDEINKLWDQGIAWLKDAGANIVDISLPHTKYALPTYYIIAPAEAASNLARYDGVRYGMRGEGDSILEMYENTRTYGFGNEVRKRIIIGTYVLSADSYENYFLRAQKVRRLLKNDFDASFAQGIDLILTPATPSTAFAIGDKTLAQDPVAMYLNDIFTVTVNMAGLPGISIPAGLAQNGLPLGLQLISRPFEEDILFKAGCVIEKAAGRLIPAKWW